MGFWGRNIAGRGKGRNSGEEREDLPQGSEGSEGRKGGSNVTEVSATRLCGESWARMRTFHFF